MEISRETPWKIAENRTLKWGAAAGERAPKNFTGDRWRVIANETSGQRRQNLTVKRA